MTIKEVVTIAISVVASLGGGSVIIWAFSSWLGKVWANRILEKDRLRYQKELEAIKAELGRTSQEYIIKFSSLHAQRGDIVRDLYEKFISTQRAMHSILKQFQFASEPPLTDKIKSFVENFDTFYQFYLKRRIYFSKSVCNKIEDLTFTLRDIHIDINTYPVDLDNVEYEVNPDLLEKRQEYWEQAQKSFNKKAESLAEDIESEFRKLLGVEEISEQLH